MNGNKTNKSKRSNKPKRVRRRLRKKVKQTIMNKRPVRRLNRIPAAIARRFNKQWRIIRQDSTSVTITGKDLIYSIPDSMIGNNLSNVMTIITANPAYWIGTRMATMASSYQNYRPISLSVTYVPYCGSTQVGTVIGGTIWQQAPVHNALQQSLQTSNGGFMTQAYAPMTRSIILGSNLQKNLYQMGGDLEEQSNPFIFLAITQGCYNERNERIIPGFFYIQYTYTLKNPIGTSVAFNTSAAISVSNISKSVHRTLFNITLPTETQVNTTQIPIGTLIHCETLYDEQDKEFDAYFIQGTQVELNKNLLVWEFANYPITQPQPQPEDEAVELEVPYSEAIAGDGEIHQIPYGAILYKIYEGYQDPTDGRYIATLFNMSVKFRVLSNSNTNYPVTLEADHQYFIDRNPATSQNRWQSTYADSQTMGISISTAQLLNPENASAAEVLLTNSQSEVDGIEFVFRPRNLNRTVISKTKPKIKGKKAINFDNKAKKEVDKIEDVKEEDEELISDGEAESKSNA